MENDRTGDAGRNVMDLVGELEGKVRDRTAAMEHFKSMYYMALTTRSPQFWLGNVTGILASAVIFMVWRMFR